MPSFFPNLGSQQEIDVPTTSEKDSYVHLCFHVTFQQDEDRSGLWEVWTNLPALDSAGNRLHEDGQWHTLPFKEPIYPTFSADPNAVESLADLGGPDSIIVRAETRPSSSPPRHSRFSAEAVIVASEGRFEFTFRRTFPSGEVHWLGGEGGNGCIITKASEAVNATDGITPAKANVDDLGAAALFEESWAIALVPDGPARVFRISENETFQANLLLSWNPIVNRPFSAILSSAVNNEDDSKGEWLCRAYPDLMTSTGEPSRSCIADTPRDAIAPLFEALHSKDFSIEFSNGDTNSGISVLAIRPLVSTQYIGTSMVIIAPPSSEAKVAVAKLPNDDQTQSPLLIGDPSTALKQYVKPPTSGEFQFVIPPSSRPVVQVYEVLSFNELRGYGDEDAVWVCAPRASSIEYGEEEVAVKVLDHSRTEDDEKTSMSSPKLVSGAPDQANRNESEGQAKLDDGQEQLNGDGPSPTDSTIWTALEAIGSFIATLFEFLLKAFDLRNDTASPKLESEDGGPSILEESDEESQEIETPPNETTPLLPKIAESDSSTLTSLTTSPAKPSAPSLPGLAPLVDMSVSASALTTPQIRAQESIPPFFENTEEKVEIRSYLRFAFAADAKKDAYIFMLPPQTSVEGRVRAAMRETKNGVWKEVKLNEKIGQGKECGEISIPGVQAIDGEVEIELERL